MPTFASRRIVSHKDASNHEQYSLLYSSSSGEAAFAFSKKSSPTDAANENDKYAPFERDNICWDYRSVAKAAFVPDKRPIILFDGQCNLCNGSVNFALDHDPKAHFRFVSLQSVTGQSLLAINGKSPKDLSSIVLCYPDDTYFESDAVLKISQGLVDLPFQVIGVIGFICPKFIRDALYGIFSENRFRFSEFDDQCRLDFDGEFDDRFLDDPVLEEADTSQ